MSDGTRARKPVSSRSSEPPAPPESSLDRAFRNFRESAVRLVERVNDLRAENGNGSDEANFDLRRVRTVFGKWSTEILLVLHSVPSTGFEDLRRALPGISPRILSSKLKSLESEQLIRREIVDSRPPRVRYQLTDRGWTVTWLAQPILLYLREDPEARRAPPPPRAAATPAVRSSTGAPTP